MIRGLCFRRNEDNAHVRTVRRIMRQLRVAWWGTVLFGPPGILGQARDSSGVRILLNPPSHTVPVRFRADPVPLLAVGGLEAQDRSEFDARQGYLSAERLHNGGLVVIDGTRPHFFSSTGRRVRIVGRPGRGPGEFVTLAAICRTLGDTIVVGDVGTRRITVLDSSGQVARSFPQRDLVDPGSWLLLR